MHKVNTAISTRFLFVLDSTKAVQTGKTVTYEIRKPDDTVFASGNMSEIGNTGIYKLSWTPNVVGWWIFKISCASPVANAVRTYFVESGLEKDIKDLLEHGTYGLSALETLVDEVETYLKHGTYGLAALNTDLDAIISALVTAQADLDNPNQYKADVSALALEATLGTHDTDIKALINALNDPTASAVADAVWDEVTSGHVGVGTFGRLLADLLTESQSHPTLAEIEAGDIASVLADTNELQTDWVDGGRLDLLIDAIKAKTDNIPASPATEAKQDIIIGYIDAEVSAILTDTNELQTDLADGGRLDLLIDAIKAKTDTIVWTDVAALENKIKASPSVDSIFFKSGGATCPANKSIWDALGDGTVDLNALSTAIAAVNTDLGDYSAQSNLTSLLVALGIPDVAGKSLYVCLITDRLDNATYGLNALKTEIDANETKIDTLTTNLGTHDTDIKAELGHATYGLSALRTQIQSARDEIEAIDVMLTDETYGLSALETLVDEVESLLKNATYGLSALKAEIDANEAKIDALNDLSAAQVNAEVDTALADIHLDHLIQTASTINDAGATATDFDTALVEASNDHYNGLLIVFTSGALAGQARRIKDYDGTSKNIIVHTAFTEAPANSDAFVIITGNYSDLIERTKGLDDIHDDLVTVLADTNELQADLADGGRLDLLIDAIKAKTDNLPASPAPASEYDTEMARITANVATEAKQDIIDTNVDDIEIDTADIQPRVPRITCHMDFWSENDDEVVLTTTATDDHALPSCVVAGLPAGVTLIRVVALLKIALIKDTSTADNAVNGATALKVDADGGYGSLVTAIDIPDNSWAVDVSEATERGGDVMIGDNDIKAEVTQNATYYARLENIACDGNNLKLKDIAWGLRVYFTV